MDMTQKKVREELFDYLNNILFREHSTLIKVIEQWFVDNGFEPEPQEVANYASDFIDYKELYDLKY